MSDDAVHAHEDAAEPVEDAMELSEQDEKEVSQDTIDISDAPGQVDRPDIQVSVEGPESVESAGTEAAGKSVTSKDKPDIPNGVVARVWNDSLCINIL
jgi:hypothetical protein